MAGPQSCRGDRTPGFYPFAIKDLLRDLGIASVPVQHCPCPTRLS
jgi:hypothetical protein